MTTVYAAGQTGSDANAGTIGSPVLTLAAAKALISVAGGTINAKEVFRETLSFSSAYSNVTVQQWQGQTAAWVRGDVIISTSWTSIGNNQYTTNPGASLSIKWLVYDWINRVNSRGAHYGTVPLTANVGAVSTGTTPGFFYNNGTGLITANFAGANPITAGVEIGYVSRENSQAFTFLGGDSNVVSGIKFGCWHNSIQGGCVWMEDQQNSNIIGCEAYDSGPHPFIHLAEARQSINNSIVNCRSDGAVGNATHMEQFAQDATGTPVNFNAISNIVESHLWLGLDGNEIPALTITGGGSGNTQVGFYCHAISGTFMQGMTVEQMQWRLTGTDTGYTTGARPVAGDNILRPASAGRKVYTNYGIHALGGTYETITGTSGHPSIPLSFGVAYTGIKGHKPDATLQADSFGSGKPAAFCLGFDGNVGYDRFCLVEGCEFIGNCRVGDNAAAGLMGVNDTNDHVSLLVRNRCSGLNTSDLSGANFEAIDRHYDATANKIEDSGSILKHLVTGSAKAMCIEDANLTAGNHAYSALSISGVSDASSRYSQRAGCGNLAGWVANIDPLTRDDTAYTIFPNSPTDLSIKHGTLWGVTGLSVATAPSQCADGAYHGYYGAYQEIVPVIVRTDYRSLPESPQLYAFHYVGFGSANAATGGVAADAYSASGLETRFTTYVDPQITRGILGHVFARYAGEGANHKCGIYPATYPSTGGADVNSAVWNEVKNATSSGDANAYLTQYPSSLNTRKSLIYPPVFYGGPATFNAAQANALFYYVPKQCGGDWYVDVGSVLDRTQNPKQKSVQTAAITDGVHVGYEPFDLRGFTELDAWFSEAATGNCFAGMVVETAMHLGSSTRAEVATAAPNTYYTKFSIGDIKNTTTRKQGRSAILIPANGGTTATKLSTLAYYASRGYDIWIDVDPMTPAEQLSVVATFQSSVGLGGSVPSRAKLLAAKRAALVRRKSNDDNP